MIIKKFQGKTEDDALRIAREELGDNVVVMNVKENVKSKGFFGFFRPKLTEVTVAKEEEAEILSRKANEDEIKATIASVDKLREKTENTKKNDDKNESGEDEVTRKLDSIQAILEEKIKKEENTVSEADKNESDEKDDEDGKNGKMIDFLKLLYNTMIDNEVNEQYANQMIEEIEQSFDKDTQMEYILSHIYQKMILKFGKSEVITPSTGKCPKLIYFIGPTGVGKTTTLAKIASMLAIVDNKKVALFTADTYRIAATEQLKTYANILNTPFHIIYTSDEMLDNFEKYKDYDYILVDTAGHSHHNEEQRENMKDFVHALDEKAEKEVYLVLSATTKYRDLISIADSYKEMADYKLIFTKLDETSTYGNLLNVRIHTGAPLSYVTCGQNVPDDIEKFNPQDTVRKLLSES